MWIKVCNVNFRESDIGLYLLANSLVIRSAIVLRKIVVPSELTKSVGLERPLKDDDIHRAVQF